MISVGSLEPRVHLVLTPAGLEVSIRYPVNSKNGAAIDERVSRELLQAIEQEPKLEVVGAKAPTIRRQPHDPAVGDQRA